MNPSIQAPAAPDAADKVLHYLPVALFGSVMGLAGLSAAWRLAQRQFGMPAWISDGIGMIAIAAFVVLACAYAVKFIGSPDSVHAEFVHPIASNLFGTILISLLLLPIVLAPLAIQLAQTVWIVGAVGMLLFAWRIVDRWMTVTQHPTHATPAWVIPVVGLLDVPLALPSLTLPPLPGVQIFSLAVGLFFAVPVFTLVFARLMFQDGLPPALQPTLLILIAPFAVGTSTYAIVTGRVDLFAQSLYAITLFLLCVLIGRLRHLLRCCPFRTGWWAVSFPLAASASAGLRVAASDRGPIVDGIAFVLLALATAVIGWLALRTALGIAKGELKSLTG